MAKHPSILIQNKKTSQQLSNACELVLVSQASKEELKVPKNAYAPTLRRLSTSEAFQASYKSLNFVRFGGLELGEHVLFIGCGSGMSSLTHEKMRILGGLVYQKAFQEKIQNLIIPFDEWEKEFGKKSLSQNLKGFLEGILLSSYKYDHHKSAEEKQKMTVLKSVVIHSVKGRVNSEYKTMAQDLEVMIEAVNVTRNWSNYPSNVGTPEFFAKESQKLAKAYGLKCRVLTEDDCAKEGMDLLLSVGQGSENESRVVVLEYNPKVKKAGKTIALVGKGVTFDTGGISIKPSAKMEEMKHDMTGAATVMGALLMASRLQVKNKIVAIMGFVENKPDGFATNPGDVYQARNGKTVEIINTDAEGRLVLADILDFAHDFKPDIILDAATLTGAVVVALANYCCALLGNDQKTIELIKKAAEENGERVWQLPLYPEFLDEMKSEFADLKNIGSGRGAGTGLAAYFLKQFIKNDTKWVHFDIAGTAWGVDFLSYCPKKGASGLHVRTMVKFIQDYK